MKRLTANAGLLAKIVGPKTNAKKPRKKEIALNQKLPLTVVKCVTLSRGGTKLSEIELETLFLKNLSFKHQRNLEKHMSFFKSLTYC